MTDNADKRAKIAALTLLDQAREVIDGWADDKWSEWSAVSTQHDSSDLENDEETEDPEVIRLSDEADSLSRARDKIEELISFIGELPPLQE